MYVVGTAGHVDHGKTALIKAMTGVDTDRLKEEKERGMTIELGFTDLWHEGKQVSLIDVPGHEKLIKTMVAGTGGMDMALMIVDGQQGIQPQTVEHLHILRLLGVKDMIVVLTKWDLVEPSKKQQILDETTEYFNDKLHKETVVYPISSLTMEGIDDLKRGIFTYLETIKTSRQKELFRMPLDRVFTIKGHGTVVTGTILSGRVKKGEELDLLREPYSKEVKVRGLQVHGKEVEEAIAGQRCAINLAKIEKNQIQRGQVLAKKGSLTTTSSLHVKIEAVDDEKITHNQKVRVNIGTTEIFGKVKILWEDERACYANIILERPIPAVKEDLFILRGMTPIRTIGGGRVLNHQGRHLPRHREWVRDYFHIMDQGEDHEVVYIFMDQPYGIKDVVSLQHESLLSHQTIFKSLKKLTSEKKVIRLNQTYYITAKQLNVIVDRIEKAFMEESKINPYRLGLSLQLLHTKYYKSLSQEQFKGLIEGLKSQKRYKITATTLEHLGDEDQEKILSQHEVASWLQDLQKAGLNGLKVSFKSKTSTPKKPGKQMDSQCTGYMDSQMVTFLKTIGQVHEIVPKSYVHHRVYDQLVSQIKDLFSKQEKWTVIELRDVLGIGRLRTIQLMEYLDDKGLTRRHENYRVLCEDHTSCQGV